MQRANLILTMLNRQAKTKKSFKFRRLYRNLFNPDFYLNAYAKMYRNEGNMTQGVDGKTIDGFGMNKVKSLIEKLKYERYKPYPVKRVYIPKKNKKKLRPLGISTVTDKLVQEVVRQILESIYEPVFSNFSHGFRPNRSCQTALYQIKQIGSGCSWVIEGDIKGFFDNIDHDILIKILSRRIDDGRFLNLIRLMLKSDIMEEGNIRESLSGAPQGGIVSPILSNIYLNELDRYMDTVARKNYKGKRRRVNPEYCCLINKRVRRVKHGKHNEARELLKKARKLQTKDPMDPNFRRIKYVRYADDFVILIQGPKSLAVSIKTEVAGWLHTNLNLELNMEKTLITNTLKDRVQFLGYEFLKGKNDSKISLGKNGVRKRVVNGIIQLLVPAAVINEKIRQFSKNGKPECRTDRMNLPVDIIIKEYNAEIRGLYNYYQLAGNVSKRMYRYQYYHYYSLVKTIARKYKITKQKTFKRFGIPVKMKVKTGTRNIIGITYQKKNAGEKTITYFNKPLVYVKRPLNTVVLFNEPKFDFKNELISRLLTGYCELCESQNKVDDLEVHHVRTVKDLKNKYKKKKKIPEWVKLMIRMNRKTLVVCKKCHRKIHA